MLLRFFWQTVTNVVKECTVLILRIKQSKKSPVGLHIKHNGVTFQKTSILIPLSVKL